MQVPNSFRDPFWSTLAADAENKYQLPKGILVSVLTNGERSNADQVSEAGARTPFQIIPSTRDAIKKKYGIDAYSSPEASAESAALLLRESLERNNGDAASAVAEYHGGTDRRNWGPRTRSYVDRVVGTGGGGGGSGGAGGGSTQPAGRARWAPITSDSPESSLDQSFNMFFGPKPSPDGGRAFQQLLTGQRFDDSTPIPANLGEEFFAGVRSATEGMASDLEYFKALGNTLIGDDESAARNVAKARIREEFAAAELQGLETFEQFLDEPTVEGFLSLAARGSGQVLPSAALSIASAGTGAIAGIFGRAVLNQANRYVAKRIIKDSVERVGQGIADSTEREIARIAYGTYRQAAKVGALAGAFGAEFAPMSGSNLGEAMDSGQPLDRANALRAAAVGVPQAAIGVGSEYALVKLLGEQATKRAAKEGGLFANFAKKVGSGLLKGAGIESPTEALQEGISVANSSDLDPLFTAQDGWLRIGEAAFIGAIGGGAVGGAGGVVGGTLDAASRLPNTSSVLQKAKGMIASGREQIINQQINSEQFGDIVPGVTNPESERDINAQLGAMFDDSTQKNAVWVAGTTPQFGAKPNQVGAKEFGRGTGNIAYAAFVPGRGTIISTNRGVVDEVIKAGASDESLAAALGYSASKDYSSPGDQVIQVLDNSGNVVSEEVANEQTAGAAMAKAQQMFGSSGKYRISVTTVEKALEDRKRRFEAERPVEIRDISLFESLPPDQQEELRRMQEPARDEQVDGTDPNESEVDQFGQGIQAVEGQRTVVRAYGRKADPNRVFDNTAQARANFESVFGETNWSDPRFAAMNESLLNAAANEQRSNPDSAVSIEDTPDGGFQLVRDDFGDLFRSINADGTETRLNVQSFLQAAIQRAKRSKYARNSRVVVVGPDGKKSAVNLVDLTAAGQRLVEGREGAGFQMREDRRTGDTFLAPEAAARAGLLEILGDLAIEGYDVQIDGQSILLNQDRIPRTLGNVTAAIVGGKRESLNWLLRPPRFKQQTQEERETAMLDEQALSERPDEVADGQSESDRMNESSVRGDELRTTMNIDTPRSAIDRRRGSGPSTINPARAEERVSSALNNMVQEIINDLLKTLKLQDPPRILTFAELDAMTPGELEQMFPKGLAAVRLGLAQMRANPSNFGKHISGEFGKVIILRESGNVLQDAIVVAHEIGHSLYKEERDKALGNKALRDRLLKAYQNSPAFKGLKEKYGFDGGFEEWFSDQVALWASKRYKNRQANSMVEKYFKDFVARLNKLWKSVSENFRKRFSEGVTQDFEQFIDSVLDSRRNQVKENGLAFTEKAFVYKLNDMVVANNGQALAAHWRGNINRILSNPKIRPLMKIVRTADGILRTYAGNEIADMFYVRAQEDGSNGRLGMLRAAARKKDELQNKFEDEIGSMDDPAVVAAMEEAASSTPTAQLTGKARQIREFLDQLYDDYILPSNTDINRQQDYFPVALNLMEILGRPDEFIDLIVANSPSISRDVARASVDKLMRVQQAILDDRPVTIDPTNPASDVVKAILLTRGVPREILQQAGFLQPPTDAFINYIRHVVKRVEFDRATKDENGNSRLEPILSRLNAEDRAVAEEILNAYLGYQSKPLSPFWRKLNSWGQFIQFVTILPFATISSLTDLAGPLINSKEFGSVTTAFKQIAATIKNRKEAEQLARDIGVVTHETVANAWVTEAEQDYMDPKVRKMSDAYFRLIGLNFFTRFSREFAAGMGVQFITKHARNEFNNPRSDRYLRELGLTREDVMTWLADGRQLSTPEGQKVKQALQRFVESSILRPNAAERPLWASDPHWALVWQLKAYFYSYAKVILGGVKSEAAARLQETPGTPLEKLRATGAIFALTAVATMPLAMLGMELREYAKYGLAWLLPGVEADSKYFRSDRMDWPEYAVEVFDRSGFAGPLAMATMANQSAAWGNSPLFTLLGPTAETIDEAISNGWRVDRTIKNRLLPIYNQL